MKRNAVLLAIAGLLLASPLLPADPDGPGKGVARLSLINGDVSVRRGDSGDWVAAVINAPLLADDRVLTGPASRAEVQFDYYHRLRLAADTEIRLTQLEYRLYQITVVRGTVTFSALKGGDAQVELNTPAAALRPLAWGEYRITVPEDDRAELTVRRGEAEIYTPEGSQRLRPGRTLLARLDESNRSETRLIAEIPRDRWDEFNQARDRELARAARVYRYVSRDIYGAEDLDGYGTWIYVAPYGWCWRPWVAVGWAPYRLGRWVWLDWYGWTWISYDPWGWAPYHYGRWFWWDNAWLWYPGPVIGVRHWWSPALVAWFGWSSWGGFSAGVGLGWGAVGWVPLAPFEPLYPWWGPRFAGFRSVNYVYQNTTIIHNTNITHVYRNARVRDGVTVVRGEDFVRGHAGRPLRLGGDELARASLARGALPVAPARESLRWADREPAVRRADLHAGRSERFFSRMPAARAERVPFDEQRRTLEQWSLRNGEPRFSRESFTGRNGPPAGAPGAAGGEMERNSLRSAERGGAAEGDRGWRRAEEPRRTGTRATENEWRRFGDPGVGLRTPEGTRTRTSDTEGIRARGEARSEDSSRGGAGWRSFGDPARSPVRGMEGEPAGRRSWSTGREAEAAEPIRGASRAESLRGTAGRGTDSSGIASPREPVDGVRGASPGEPGRIGSPRWSTGGGREEGGTRMVPELREATPRDERPGEPGRGGEERRAAPREERGIRLSPMTRGGWSTGGGAGAADSGISVSPRPAEAGSGIVDLSPRRATGGDGIRVGPATGEGGHEPDGRATPRTERFRPAAPMTRGGWSTGGGAAPVDSGISPSPRPDGSGSGIVDLSPRQGAGGGAAIRGGPDREDSGRRFEGLPRSERFVPAAPMTRGGWSTGGGAVLGEDAPAGSAPRFSGAEGVGGTRPSWRTGGGMIDASPRSGGSGSTGGRTGWAADGPGSSMPSISVPRSEPSFGMPRSAPSWRSDSGGMRTGPGFGGSGIGAPPSLGGGIRGGGAMSPSPGGWGGSLRGGSALGAPSAGGGLRGGRAR